MQRRSNRCSVLACPNPKVTVWYAVTTPSATSHRLADEGRKLAGLVSPELRDWTESDATPCTKRPFVPRRDCGAKLHRVQLSCRVLHNRAQEHATVTVSDEARSHTGTHVERVVVISAARNSSNRSRSHSRNPRHALDMATRRVTVLMLRAVPFFAAGTFSFERAMASP